MKQLFLPVLMFAFLLTACNNDKKITTTEKNEDGSETKTSVEVKGVATTADEMNQKMEALKKLTALTTDQLKALLPEDINGIKRTEYNTNSMAGYSVAIGEYRKDDSTELELTIYDCAGEAGAGMYGLTYWGAMNYQQESSTEYTKTIDFRGGKAIENYHKNNNTSTLTYVANERLLVVLKGQNMSPDELKTAAEKLNLKIS
jgi:hypothetical protein